MTIVVPGFGTLGPSDLIVNGGPILVDALDAITDVIVERDITSATTITLELDDPFRNVLRSGVFNYGDTLTLAGSGESSFTLVQFVKASDQLELVFESTGVFQLRQQVGVIATTTSTTDLSGFAAMLVAEVPGLSFVGEPDPLQVPLVGGIGRGTSTDTGEDSWSCLTRLATSAGWRCWEANNTVYFGSDPYWLSTMPSLGILQEFTDQIMNMDFDWDIGKPYGSITATAFTGLWTFSPGQVVTVQGMGPADGVWLVQTAQRDLYNPLATIQLTVPLTAAQLLVSTSGDLSISGLTGPSPAQALAIEEANYAASSGSVTPTPSPAVAASAPVITGGMSFGAIENLWNSQGGNPLAAPVMAGIAMWESSGSPSAYNNTPSTGDLSVGLWQENFYGSLIKREQEFNTTPTTLRGDAARQAQIAIIQSNNGASLSPWTSSGDDLVAVKYNDQPFPTDVEVVNYLNSTGRFNISIGSAAPFTAKVTLFVTLQNVAGATQVTSGTPGTTLYFTAQVLPTTKTVPTGTVSFAADGVGLPNVQAATGNKATGIVQAIVTGGSHFSVGTHTIVATYNGDNNYQPATSNIITYTVI